MSANALEKILAMFYQVLYKFYCALEKNMSNKVNPNVMDSWKALLAHLFCWPVVMAAYMHGLNYNSL